MKIDDCIKKLMWHYPDADVVLESYKEAFDTDKEFCDFMNIVRLTTESARNIINDIKVKTDLAPEHKRNDFIREQQEQWYHCVIENPTSYSMRDTSFETICEIIYSWVKDNEYLAKARRGIVCKLVYDFLRDKNCRNEKDLNPQCASVDNRQQRKDDIRKGDAEQKNKKRGRPTKEFKECIVNDNDGDRLAILHKAMSGKKGKDAALIIQTAIEYGWISTPTYKAVVNEFGDIGSEQNYSKYVVYRGYTDAEKKGARAQLGL